MTNRDWKREETKTLMPGIAKLREHLNRIKGRRKLKHTKIIYEAIGHLDMGMA